MNDKTGSTSDAYSLRQHRTLTPSAQEEYEINVKKYLTALHKIGTDIELLIQTTTEPECELLQVGGLIHQKFQQYEKTSAAFTRFLEGIRTLESETENSTNNLVFQSIRSKVETVFSELYKQEQKTVKTETELKDTFNMDTPPMQEQLDQGHDNDKEETKPSASQSQPEQPTVSVKQETRSDHQSEEVEQNKHDKSSNRSQKARSRKSKSITKSIVSKRSGQSAASSHLNSMYIKQKAKLEGLRVRMKYAQQEAELLKKKADIEVDMKLLSSKREYEECERGFQINNECFESDNEQVEESESSSEIRKERVLDYVQEQPTLSSSALYAIDHNNNNHSASDTPFNTEPRCTTPRAEVFDKPLLNVHSKPFTPKIHAHTENNQNQEVAKFIVNKDLLLSRIQKFNDKPECFGSWRKSFSDTVTELELSPAEEVDLLIKWLGPESSKLAISIRASNFTDPARARDRIWERLYDRYARPEMVESSVKLKLMNFSKISNKEHKHLYDLVDIVSEIESIKEADEYRALFSYFDSSAGVNPIVSKLPYQLQEKWTLEANRYKESHNASYTPFTLFVSFLRKMARMRNDPSFIYEETKSSNVPKTKHTASISVCKTDLPTQQSSPASSDSRIAVCPLHETNHTLNKCFQFREKPLQERHDFIKSKGICFRCCGQKKHLAKDCKSQVTCGICKSNKHPTALHVSKDKPQETQKQTDKQNNVTSSCTKVCRNPTGTSKSCAKTVLVRVYQNDNPENSLLTYAIIDEQSNKSLARFSLFDHFNIQSGNLPYSLSSCSGTSTEYGRRANNLTVESFDSSCKLNLPVLIECDRVPNLREEIPSPEVARGYTHLQDIAENIPIIDDTEEILLLIGRDLLQAHHVLDQKIGPAHLPYAQKLHLGWVIVGESCLSATHQHDDVSVMKTFTLKDGRASAFLEPCENEFHMQDIFSKSPDDDKPGLSIEDKRFLSQMEKEIYKDEDGLWTAPLPFRKDRQMLPNNRSQALKRALILDSSLEKNHIKQGHVYEFMDKIIKNGHAEEAPPLAVGSECWYLPLFAVYHHKKPGSVRCVFDSSAKFGGISLNSVLLTGPDLINSLLGILFRFRQFPIAVTADIEQMFYRFSVPPDQRNYLGFFWHKDNKPENELIEYRMTRHVFGNSPSPAIATVGLRRSVANADEDIRDFVERNFYVDDGLASFETHEEAASLLLRTQKTLQDEGNIRLHKIASNNTQVMESFPESDLAKDFKGIDLDLKQAPLQRSLGVIWDMSRDVFTFQVCRTPKPFTKRGLLSTINSLYDPIGIVAPVTVCGKVILRDVMSQKTEWDDLLPETFLSRCKSWESSRVDLESVSVSRCYSDISPSDTVKRELHVFSDASQMAIGAVAYLKTYDINGSHRLSFVHGKAKVAPVHGHTIPRLELCAAVLAVNLKDSILSHLTLNIDSVTMYTDSRIVLGYICNEQRRFYVYVGNRVDIIRHSTTPDRWSYVPSEKNPADIATRFIQLSDIEQSIWLKGPSFLLEENIVPIQENYTLIEPDDDKELRPIVTTCKTDTCKSQPNLNSNQARHKEGIGSTRFENFSTWESLVHAIARLKHVAKSFNHAHGCKGWHMCPLKADEIKDSENLIIKEVQSECFSTEISALMEGRSISNKSSIASLYPFLDSNEVLRVGGRLNKSKKDDYAFSKNPILIPKKHHIALLLVRHFHESVYHQGRLITEGKIRSSGFWIVGGKRLISTIIHNCVICKKLRGKFGVQIMSDLPEDRLTPSPPFTFVGLDTFGPWDIIARRTRGGQANQKRWAILFTCLVSRAIHIEVAEEMSSSSFINAMRRFISIRGPVRQFRSDRGTNFVGASAELGMNTIYIEDEPIQRFLNSNQITWIFNPPHASHFGGVWERMIGISRRILDGILLRNNSKSLSHEVLVTFMAEVCSIVNSRPICAVSTDPNDSSVLTPNILLTQKSGYLPEILPEFGTKDVYRSQWRHVQLLSQEFWKKWRQQYLSTLQSRPKWTNLHDNMKEGDIVLLKDSEVKRSCWPMAVVERTFPSDDKCVRKVQIRVGKDRKQFVRPICELVPLLAV